jgi:hypothetical protein
VSQTDGYAALVAARAPALLRLAVMLTGDRADAEDLLQSTLGADPAARGPDRGHGSTGGVPPDGDAA